MCASPDNKERLPALSWQWFRGWETLLDSPIASKFQSRCLTHALPVMRRTTSSLATRWFEQRSTRDRDSPNPDTINDRQQEVN